MGKLKAYNPETGQWEVVGSGGCSAAADPVPDYVRSEAERLAKLVQSRQNVNTLSFLLGSDIHARIGATESTQMLATTKHAAQAMKIIREQVHLDFAGLLGDYVWDDGETQEQAREMFRIIHEYFHPAFVGMPQFWARGNHDKLPASGTEFTDSQLFPLIGAYNSGVVFDSGNKVLGYCYRDFEDYKIRIVLMNTTETTNSSAVGTAQNNWLKTVLNLSDKEGWKAIILSHIPLDWWGTSAEVYKTVAEYADYILCNIHGHTHNYITGVVGETTVPRIAIPNIDFYRANTYSDKEGFGESVTYDKIANSEADTAFCVVTIDFAENKLYADHYGGAAGYDREIDLSSGSGGESASYTNRLRTATSTFGGSEIFGKDYDGDGTPDGYQTNYRINSSNQPNAEASNMCTSGFIPVKAGDVVRIKNAVLVGGGATPYFHTYTSTGGHMAANDPSVLGTADANGVYTWTAKDSTDGTTKIGAFRLSVCEINANTIITVNEEIV